MKEIKPLVRGLCPVCNKTIMNEKRDAYLECGMEFFVKWNDGGNAKFAICKDCFEKLTQEQVDKIMSSQILNWGFDIQKQLSWFSKIACHLKVVGWAKTKGELEGG